MQVLVSPAAGVGDHPRFVLRRPPDGKSSTFKTDPPPSKAPPGRLLGPSKERKWPPKKHVIGGHISTVRSNQVELVGVGPRRCPHDSVKVPCE